jgi:hypothetical protein
MKTLLWLLPVIALAALVGFFLVTQEVPLPPPLLTAAPPAAKPAINYPVEPIDDPENPLPPLAKSDNGLSEAFESLLEQEPPQFVYLNSIIHRIVATVDNLPRDHVAPRLMPVKPVPGIPITESSGENLVLSPKNVERYQAYVRLVDAVPIDAAVKVYSRFYPLFQEQYESLGYPGKYFNDRVIEVIDHLLATPETEGPPALVQPRVLYEFADPKLQKLSAGQKILLRMGPANQLKLKAKLREIRQALISMAPSNTARSQDPK